MQAAIKDILKQKSGFKPYLEELEALFAEMDAAYTAVTADYGFACKGCEDNCCQTRFYHHTLLEYLYLLEGFSMLTNALQSQIHTRARHVIHETDKAGPNDPPLRLMCPLNSEGLCLLYSYRPMICRLHGIPHELQTPRNGITFGPGCARFQLQCRTKGYKRFDRTPFYQKMAALEKRLRQASGFNSKIKLTVAQMIADTDIPF